MAKSGLFPAAGFRYDSFIKDTLADINKLEQKNIRDAARVVKKEIRKRASKIKKTGNLAKGVYMYSREGATHIGLRQPAYHNYLVEFGHYAKDMTFVDGIPVVYGSFEDKADEVEAILSRPILE